MSINWNMTREDFDTISLLAHRAWRELDVARVQVLMDLNACHCNGCALDLEALLKASKGDLAHDVYGIIRHIDRATGKLTDCFLPRYARKQEE